jgi:hypothetical protein
MRKKLSSEQREAIAQKIMDWGNLVFVGLVIAQLVPDINSLNWSFVIAGVFCIMAAYATAILIMRTKGGEIN